MILPECCISNKPHTVTEMYLIHGYYTRIQIKLDKVVAEALLYDCSLCVHVDLFT